MSEYDSRIKEATDIKQIGEIFIDILSDQRLNPKEKEHYIAELRIKEIHIRRGVK